jgi:acyl-coenzyme A thioesterase PaaI-like protein
VGVTSIQDQLRDNFCWGCGADNPDGLQLKSHWDGERSVAHWMPRPLFAAGPRHFLNGGIIGTLLDCHGIVTALAHVYGLECRPIGDEPSIWHATTAMDVRYLRPVPIDAELTLHGTVSEHGDEQTVVDCVLSAAGKDRATAAVRSVRVPDSWRHGAPR